MFLPLKHQPSRTTSARTPRARCRPRLETLDDRCLLSAGALDPTFCSGGIVTTSVGPTTNWNGAAAVAIYPNAGTANDGKIVAAGVGPTNTSGKNYVEGFAVVRYQPNGTLDPSFGSGGEVTTKVSSNFSRALDVAIQTDGKIVAAGYAEDKKNNEEFALVRYNVNGSLDTTFGSGKNAGIVLGTSGVAEAMALQADGKIVVAGASSGGFVLQRYNTNGTLDTTFNGSGTVLTNVNGLGGGGGFDEEDVAIYPQSSAANAGKIVLVGRAGESVAVFRYNPNGTPDSTFGGGTGYVLLNTSDNTPTPHVAIQADDRLDVAFTNFGAATSEVSVARLQANGTLDPSFGVGGVVTTNHQLWDSATSIALQADGQIVVAGEEVGSSNAFMVARFNATDGSLDTAFGVNGFQTVPVPTTDDFGVDVAIQPDGKIVLAGTEQTIVNTKYAFALARFLPSEPQIGSCTANSSTVTDNTNVTLTAADITDANPGATITQVAFYVDVNGTETPLVPVSQTSPGVWSCTFTINLAPGSYTLIAQAEDSDTVIGARPH